MLQKKMLVLQCLIANYTVIPGAKSLDSCREGEDKAELQQLNRTQFPFLGIFVSKKDRNQKNLDHFYYISFKS